MVAHELPCVYELWIAFGTGKNYSYKPVHKIAAFLGPQKARALPIFHSLTGCDTSSAWQEISLDHMKLVTRTDRFPGYPDHRTVNIQDDTVHCTERFVVLLYDRTGPYMNVNETGKKLFAKRNSTHRIPPTYHALEQYVKRAVFQGSYTWGQVKVL